MPTKITTYKKLEITVDGFGTFHATTGEKDLGADSLKELKEKIDESLRKSRKFKKPIECIQVQYARLAKITSRVSDNEEFFWTSHEPSDLSGGEKWERSQEILVGRRYFDEATKHRFVLRTPENMKILTDIKAFQKLVAETQKSIEDLKKRFSDPVTYDYVENQYRKD